MKKIILSLATAMFGCCSYAQVSDTGDKVGIGTSSPQAKLDVVGNANFTQQLNVATVNGGTSVFWGALTVQNNKATTLTGTLDVSGQTSISGNVGIGTTSPGSSLQVNGVTSIRTNTTTDGYVSINPGSSTYQGYINWWKPGGTRVGYMGYTDGSSANNLALTLEASANFVVNGGNVLIGQTTQANAAYRLDVKGSARANEIVVNTTGADFVFDKKYALPKLSDVKAYIGKNHHLPEIASAKEMQTNGVELGQLNTKLLQKEEELTLYLIDKDKQLIEQQKQIDDLKKQQIDNEQQEARIASLEKKLSKLTSNQSK